MQTQRQIGPRRGISTSVKMWVIISLRSQDGQCLLLLSSQRGQLVSGTSALLRMQLLSVFRTNECKGGTRVQPGDRNCLIFLLVRLCGNTANTPTIWKNKKQTSNSRSRFPNTDYFFKWYFSWSQDSRVKRRMKGAADAVRTSCSG